MDERELLERAKDGHGDAFAGLVRLHQDRVYNLILRNVDDGWTAADLTQEVFVRAWRIIGEYDGRAKFSTWLFRVAMNAVVSHHRYTRAQKRGGGRHASLDADNATDPANDARSLRPRDRAPADELVLRETERRVVEAIANLEPEFREVTVLRDIEGLSYEEIAEVLGINTGTVRSRLFRARERLREALKDLADDQ